MLNSSSIKILAFGNSTRKQVKTQLGKFLAGLIITSFFCLAGYIALVDHLVQRSLIPATYKWFLLKDVPGPRIIFESGSNSHHAINTDLVSKAMGMTAINIADNGGYALEDKITRLEKYTHPGDVVILPLEWVFYYREDLTDNYVETLFTFNRDYYRSMPFIKRAKRALTLPPEKVISEFSKRSSRLEHDNESPAKDLFLLALTRPTGHQSKKNSSGRGAGIAEQTCDDYVLGKETQRQNLKVGSTIKRALRRLQKLKSRGIKIHFAWPVLAGDGCLSSPTYVKEFGKEIERNIKKAGFDFLGTPSQSLYDQKFQDDSPYHLITQGTIIHTQKMIGFLKAAGYGGKGTPLDIKAFARHRLLELELAQTEAAQLTAMPVDQNLAMDNPNIRQYVEFTAGWWAIEPYGRWMRDNRAMFRLTLPDTLPENSMIKIKGITKSGRAEPIKISLNGRLILSGYFGNTPLLIPTNGLPRGKTLSIFIDLPEAGLPRSPFELGENQDTRSMTLHFQSIMLISPNISEDSPSHSHSLQQDQSTTALKNPNTLTAINNCSTCGVSGHVRQSSITYDQGWWAQEASGRWMKGNEAAFTLKFSKRAQDARPLSYAPLNYSLKLVGDFFLNQPQAIKIFVDGNPVKTIHSPTDGIIISSFNTNNDKENVKVTIQITNPTIKSPKQLGLSQDSRTLTYFLKSAELTSS